MTSYLARTTRVAPTTRPAGESHWNLALQVLGLAAVSAPYGLPLMGDAAFGMLLCLLVVMRFYRFLNGCAARSDTELAEFSRRCCRGVYLTLYAVLLVQMLCRILSVSWSSGGMALGWSLPFQAAPRNVVMQCGEAFRGHLFCGVIALLLIRGLSAYHLRRGRWRRPIEGAPAQKE